MWQELTHAQRKQWDNVRAYVKRKGYSAYHEPPVWRERFHKVRIYRGLLLDESAIIVGDFKGEKYEALLLAVQNFVYHLAEEGETNG